MPRVIFGLLLLLLTTSAFGQIGFRGGLNYSNVSVDPGGVEFGGESKVGYHLGLQGNISLGGLTLRPALLYHLKGGKEEMAGTIGQTNLHYIEVPVNLAFRLGTNRLAIIIEGGPYFGYLMNTSSGFIDNLDDRLNKSDWGINFGAVVEISGFGFGANYSNSLGSIAKDDRLGQAFKTTNGNLALFGYMNF